MATVLLVDDSEQIRKTSTRMLERMGHQVIVAHDGDEAIGVLKNPSLSIDLVISDVRMPNRDGIELLRWLTTWMPHIVDKFAFCSASPEIIANNNMESVPLIEKPCLPVEFRRIVTNLLQGIERANEQRE